MSAHRYSFLTGNHPDFEQLGADTFADALERSVRAVQAYGRAGAVDRHNSAVTGTCATIGANGYAFPTDITTEDERAEINARNDRHFAEIVERRARTGARLALTSEWV